jgi:hypothetical protein
MICIGFVTAIVGNFVERASHDLGSGQWRPGLVHRPSSSPTPLDSLHSIPAEFEPQQDADVTH